MTTIIFFVSFFALLLLGAFRAYQMKMGPVKSVTDFYTRCDLYLNKMIESIFYKYKRWSNISHIFFFEFLPSLVYEVLVKSKDFVSRKYYENGDRFRGRRALRSHGSVSFFLGRLSEEKTSRGEGGI